MSKEKNQPQDEELLKNEEAAQETAQTEETPAEETPAQELTVEEQLANMLGEAQQMVNEEKDRYLRLAAEFDNYRKRTLKEKAELIKNGGIGEQVYAMTKVGFDGSSVNVNPVGLLKYKGFSYVNNRKAEINSPKYCEGKKNTNNNSKSFCSLCHNNLHQILR